MSIWCASTVISAGLWAVGTGLRPVPLIAFLAPLPVLWLAPRYPARALYAAAVLSWLGGTARYWPYFVRTLEQPVLAAAVLLGGSAVAYGACVLLFRALLARHRIGLAALAFPAAWTCAEYLYRLVGGVGAWWSIGYSQAEVGPIVRIAAITGVAGITFLLLAVPAVVVAVTAPQLRNSQPLAPADAATVAVPGASGTQPRRTVDVAASAVRNPQWRRIVGAVAGSVRNAMRRGIAGARTVAVAEERSPWQRRGGDGHSRALYEVRSTRRRRIVGIAAVLTLGAGAAGAVCSAAEGPVVRVALVALAQPPMYVPVDSAPGAAMIAEAVTMVERASDQGAEVVVFTEKAWHATSSDLARLSEPLDDVARRRGVHVVVGLELEQQGGTVNAAIAYPGQTVYAKRYLVPGLEAGLRAGRAAVPVPGRPWALAICADLDHPDLVRENRANGATLLLAPALDFTVDHWLHSRMAVVRAVESGIAIARPAQLGELLGVDAQGRIDVSVETGITETHMAIADLGTSTAGTPYVRWGDWFGVLTLTLTVLGVVAALRRPLTAASR
ncbi:nitrilase-related carbon-nitrogen hydrolase [Nocardia sp. NPDC051833]|uniref:nitrilase-related carbon-nitrogen hydrolase n=1 Tax=Nocardia sp. NPDC051833 TaxID=3155674 RepID=UPI003434C707